MNLEVLSRNVSLSPRLKEHIERRMHFALGRFASTVTGAQLTLTDENGPRGGVDKRSLLRIYLRRGEDLRVEARGDELLDLVNRTAERASRVVARAVERRRWDDSLRRGRRTAAERSGSETRVPPSSSDQPDSGEEE